MSESPEMNALYALLQLLGVFLFFGCCLVCLYKKGMREQQQKIHDEQMYSKDLKLRVESLEKKIKALENNRLVTIV